MAKHLSDRDIECVVGILDGWRDKLTWEALSAACQPVIGTAPARQTLHRFIRITDAFKAAKIRLKSNQPEIKTPSMRVASERIARLIVENERLKRENSRFLEQFVVWQYNAHVKGLSDIDLNKALPAIDRGNTE
ncbi:MAG TPA: hypothetical protein VMU57_20310 [Edaphobacter sp.]|uniref:hypothetical protein n=1 Tax=Edaphobacter sp. TaxID=1934404 RepID=UPI002C77DDA5|nr:hypothetical protein [Edaphobacter sp.]HUZ97255.1 hypothetical protein [Edaphobacter sp.]